MKPPPALPCLGTALLAAGTFGAGPVWANSASLRLNGSLPAQCTLQIMETTTTLNIVDGVQEQPVATVGERCNDANGYRVVLESSNRGALVADQGERVGYTVTYGPLRNITLDQPRTLLENSARTDWYTRVLKLTIPPADDRVASTYYDMLTLTIEAR